MVFDTVSVDELRRKIADWTLRNKRSAPFPSSNAAADFIEGFEVPQTNFDFTQSYVDQNGDVIVLFKTAIHLCSWQTRTGKEPMDFSYYKVTKADLDDSGNIMDYDIKGYVVTSI